VNNEGFKHFHSPLFETQEELMNSVKGFNREGKKGMQRGLDTAQQLQRGGGD